MQRIFEYVFECRYCLEYNIQKKITISFQINHHAHVQNPVAFVAVY